MNSRNAVWLNAYSYMVGRLKQARADAGMTQMEVARRLERPRSFVSKIEMDGHGVYAVDLMFLARIYNKPLAYFFGLLPDASRRP